MNETRRLISRLTLDSRNNYWVDATYNEQLRKASIRWNQAADTFDNFVYKRIIWAGKTPTISNYHLHLET